MPPTPSTTSAGERPPEGDLRATTRVTVSAIARRCNVPDADRYVDARELPDDPAALADVAEATAVFGRVTPEAKRALLARSRGATRSWR